MGHLQSLDLPTSKAWRDVVASIGRGADAAEVAARSAKAAERAFSSAIGDAAFEDAARILVELPLAARGPAFPDFLDALGIPEAALESRTGFITALARSLDRSPAATDFGEMARMELLEALSTEFDRRLPALFPESPADIRKALGQLAGGSGFASFARRFFAGLTDRTLSYYLSRALAHETGATARFASDAERVTFEQSIARHAWEVSGIVEDYAAGWYGKTVWQGDGPTPEKIRGFAAYAFTKLRRELARHRDAS